MIEAVELVHRYGSVQALDRVSFEIPKGQVVGLVGPNGAGKTTTMKILTGYLAPSGGRALVAGNDVMSERLAAQAHIGYLPENAPLYREMSVQEYLTFMARMRKIPASERRHAISRVVRACALTDVLTRPIGHLSKGFRQRVGLAQAMVHDPDILILDEPTSGLDPTQILDIREVIRHLGEQKTVVLSTHILGEVESTCDRLLMIVAGRVHVDETMDSFRRGTSVLLALHDAEDSSEGHLAGLEGVEKVDRLEPREGARRFRLHLAQGDDQVFGRIGGLARSHSWTVVEMTREHRDLEDVFARLRSEKEAVA